jgi:hypothetical protein
LIVSSNDSTVFSGGGGGVSTTTGGGDGVVIATVSWIGGAVVVAVVGSVDKSYDGVDFVAPLLAAVLSRFAPPAYALGVSNSYDELPSILFKASSPDAA